jgi:hypothetical protein
LIELVGGQPVALEEVAGKFVGGKRGALDFGELVIVEEAELAEALPEIGQASGRRDGILAVHGILAKHGWAGDGDTQTLRAAPGEPSLVERARYLRPRDGSRRIASS